MPSGRGQFVEVIALGVCGGLLFALGAILGVLPGLLLALLIASIFLAVLVIEYARAVRTLRRVRIALRDEQVDRAALAELLADALRTYPTGLTRVGGMLRREHMLGRVAAELLRLPAPPAIVRVTTDPRHLEPLPPAFDQQFEPVRLNEHDPAFHALLDRTPTPADKLGDFWTQATGAFGRSKAGKALAIFGLSCAALGFVQFIWQFGRDLLAGQVPTFFSQVIFLLPVLGVVVAWRQWRQQRLLLVPAGVLVQRAPWYRPRWELELLRARESVAVYWPDLNMLAIADRAGRVVTQALPPRLAEAALRAWRSPHEPLELERYDDFR